MFVIPDLERQKQEDPNFKIILGASLGEEKLSQKRKKKVDVA